MISNKPESRGPKIDHDECVKHIGNRFDLVLIASARSREIAKKNKENPNMPYSNAGVSALLEIQNKLVGTNYLRKVR